jgi:hypothetical protein
MKDMSIMIIILILIFAGCKEYPLVPASDLSWSDFKKKSVRDTDGYPDLSIFPVEKKCEGLDVSYVLLNNSFRVAYFEHLKDVSQMSAKYQIQIKTKSGDYEESVVFFENANLIARFLSDSIRINYGNPRKNNTIVETIKPNDSLAVRIPLDYQNSLLTICPIYPNCPE